MAYSTILAEIKTVMESVNDIGRVQDYLRYWKDDAHFKQLFQATVKGKKQIRGWTITRDGVPVNSRYASSGQHRLTYNFVIRGYLGVSDGTESEKTMQALVDEIIEKLDNAITLGGNVLDSGPAVCPTITHSEFGNVLCHYAEIQFPATEHALRTYS